jgi:hypothetical protein
MALAVAVAADLFFVSNWVGRFERLKFHPFLAYDDPGSYKYAHAQERYVYDVRHRIWFSQRKPPGVVRIVLMGASTMLGSLNSTERSPGARLLWHLKAARPGRVFEVITLAEPAKYQLNELIDAAVTVPHWDPDLVVSWNGFNEVWYGEGEDHYEGMPNTATEVEASIEASALEAWLYRHTFFGSRLFDWACERASARYALREPDDYEPPRYYAYLRREARLLGDAGIRYAHSFCPNVSEKSPRSPAEKRETLRLAWLRAEVVERRRLSAQIVREEGQIAYDVMESLTGTEQTLFADFCHLNDEGSDRAARDLASRVLQWLTQPKPSRWSGRR